jgi:hypothetical protein
MRIGRACQRNRLEQNRQPGILKNRGSAQRKSAPADAPPVQSHSSIRFPDSLWKEPKRAFKQVPQFCSLNHGIRRLTPYRQNCLAESAIFLDSSGRQFDNRPSIVQQPALGLIGHLPTIEFRSGVLMKIAAQFASRNSSRCPGDQNGFTVGPSMLDGVRASCSSANHSCDFSLGFAERARRDVCLDIRSDERSAKITGFLAHLHRPFGLPVGVSRKEDVCTSLPQRGADPRPSQTGHSNRRTGLA